MFNLKVHEVGTHDLKVSACITEAGKTASYPEKYMHARPPVVGVCVPQLYNYT